MLSSMLYFLKSFYRFGLPVLTSLLCLPVESRAGREFDFDSVNNCRDVLLRAARERGVEESPKQEDTIQKLLDAGVDGKKPLTVVFAALGCPSVGFNEMAIVSKLAARA